MSVIEIFYFTATIVLIVVGAAMAFIGWRIHMVLVALHEVLTTTRETLSEIKETPRRLESGVMSSALNIARFIWGRG